MRLDSRAHANQAGKLYALRSSGRPRAHPLPQQLLVRGTSSRHGRRQPSQCLEHAQQSRLSQGNKPRLSSRMTAPPTGHT
eukprot:scaffold1300_cov317-Prasinococcus_capsulatus_cf.AAC.3